MPSTMIHLMLANKLSSNYPTEFFIGNIAPDVVSVRKNYTFKDKDILHFRNSNNRLENIENLASTLNMKNPYCEGYIMHLFFDMHWDKDCIKTFINNYQGENWVSEYRKEINMSSSWLYHNNITIKNIWNDVINYNIPILNNIQGITQDEITISLQRTDTWNKKYNLDDSLVYPQTFIDDYTTLIAEKYRLWRKTL